MGFTYEPSRNGVKTKARRAKINISYIPTRQTGEYQPLDGKIFGALEKMAHEDLDSIFIDKDMSRLDMIDALVVIVNSWERMSENNIKKSWDHLCLAHDLPPEEHREECDSAADSDVEYEYSDGEEEEDEGDQEYDGEEGH